jgi:hypothetical protein
MDWKHLAETVNRMADFLLLGNCSCVTLLPSIHGHMQNLHFHRPWWSDEGDEPPWMVSRRVVGGCARFMSRIKENQA